ncbi:TlpA family protein disulfide reductase [Leeuwenhoekiella polynyae]|nr:TlpA disulfide reductase family protein [Leeuwenhoekiella polynyae]
MKKLSCLAALILTLSGYCQKSDRQILMTTIDELNKIETVHYQTKNESIESGVTFQEFDASVFFDFRNTTTTPRYYLEQDEMELIFDGQRHIMSLSDEKIIVTNNKPNVNNPLLLSLYSIKVLLPQMLQNKNVTISRKKDTLINNSKNYVFELSFKNGYLDFNKLTLTYFPEANFQSNYLLMVDKLSYLPTKMIMPNGDTGSISRTYDNLDFNYVVDEDIWSGNQFSSDYEKITFEEYNNRMQAKMTLNSKGNKNEIGKRKITDWKIPNLKTDELIDFSTFEGKVVLLEFWFKFCGPCVQAVPQLNSMNEKYKNEDFLMYGVEFHENDPRKNLLEYISKIGMNYSTLYKGKEIATNFSIGAAPTFMILDKKGNVVFLESGFDQSKIEKILKDYL